MIRIVVETPQCKASVECEDWEEAVNAGCNLIYHMLHPDEMGEGQEDSLGMSSRIMSAFMQSTAEGSGDDN